MEALKEEGNRLFRKGQFSRAVEKYQRAITAATAKDSTKDIAAVHSNLSCSLLKLARVREALQEAESCVEIMPVWHKGWFRKGEAQFALQQYADAEESYKKALDLSPDDVSIKKRMMLSLEAQQGFFFRQLSPGRDFCVGRGSNVIEAQIFQSAQQMRNFIYLVGDAKSREVVVVDAAWDVEGIKRFAEEEHVKIVGAVVTHHHFDHTGGIPPPPFDALGIRVPGVREVASAAGVKVYVNKQDADVIRSKNGVPSSSLVEVDDGERINVGDIVLKFIHTPGHTPGSQCVLVERNPGHGDENILLSGDTLFIGSCGRLDLPDANPKDMYVSLQNKLASLPAATRVYPGHDYGGCHTTIGQEQVKGFLRPISLQDWTTRQHKL